MKLPKKLLDKLEQRKENNTFRSLGTAISKIDFSSNDYLGFSRSETLFKATHHFLEANNIKTIGATGSRLLSGNSTLHIDVENKIKKVHNSESALLFNSGYDANLGFFEAVPQRGDFIFYDESTHASIRDGIRLSNARSYKFKHNNLEDLKNKIEVSTTPNQLSDVYVVTESVFSMDGDTPDVKAFSDFCNSHDYKLIIDEAHALGVFGEGKGIVQALGIESQIFARIVTFGKGLGGHGAAILGSISLKEYLVNFARSFIYTTALPPHALATIITAYDLLFDAEGKKSQEKLTQNIQFFNKKLVELGLNNQFIASNSAIHCCVISGNKKVKDVASKLNEEGFDVKPILSPTVPEGEERLRICLHSYNTEAEIAGVLEVLTNLIEKE